MRLSDLLNPNAVSLQLQARTKPEALEELVRLLETGHSLDSHGEILDRVVRREAMLTTGVGHGVAVPHGKARAVTRTIAACAISRDGVDFDAADEQRVHILVLFVSPEHATTEHVRVLASLSRLLKEETVRASLREAASVEAFMEALRGAERAYLP